MNMNFDPIAAKGCPHRFSALRQSSAALLAFLFFLGAAQAAERPNIVIFLADDLGYGSVGYQGGKSKTPTLDTLAKEAVRFTDFYTGSCNCSPSRASLLTGRSATRVGIYNWRPGRSPMALRGSEVTLAELLRGAGYRTGVFGKWHLGEVMPHESVLTPADHGFEHSFVTDLNAAPSHRNPANFIRNGAAVGESQGYSCQIVVDEALRVLETLKPGESFFHYIPFHEPHVPLASPEELVKGYPGATKEEAVYYANVENIDRAIGRYLAALKTRGLSGNTLVLFASDNGPTGPGSSSGGLRGQKETLYDGGIKVPALLAWPSRIPKPRTISEPVALVDVMPTLCEAAGVAGPADRVLDGMSFLPLLTGGTFTRAKPLFWFYFNRDPGAALRSGDWNLVARTTGFQPAGHNFTPEMMELVRSRTFDTFELFNLKAGPGQRNDVATQHPEKLAELKKQLLDSLASARAEGPDWRVAK
jgi:arylsulfatase A